MCACVMPKQTVFHNTFCAALKTHPVSPVKTLSTNRIPSPPWPRLCTTKPQMHLSSLWIRDSANRWNIQLPQQAT